MRHTILVDRAREMYSSCLVKEDFLKIKKIMTKHSRKTARSLERCNKELLELKRGCEERRLYDPIEIEPFVMKALRLSSLLEEYLHGRTDSSDYMGSSGHYSGRARRTSTGRRCPRGGSGILF